ncbi:hypothetical protein [Oryzomonas rubra]|uniref:Uncharacterized protein n=1 Tax=Oryzomonas rubra TaxID=2509454 RepID=A0A5A9X7H3_9BACT|nr:hypothetical protein [Oryzomonas rubra]KAA0888744.1 hypothetical protein ET418_15300 [Oryzomonas rubra]
MKTTLRQLESLCSGLNTGVLKSTPYGLGVVRYRDVIAVIKKARSPVALAGKVTLFIGSPRECQTFLLAVDGYLRWFCEVPDAS